MANQCDTPIEVYIMRRLVLRRSDCCHGEQCTIYKQDKIQLTIGVMAGVLRRIRPTVDTIARGDHGGFYDGGGANCDLHESRRHLAQHQTHCIPNQLRPKPKLP